MAGRPRWQVSPLFSSPVLIHVERVVENVRTRGEAQSSQSAQQVSLGLSADPRRAPRLKRRGDLASARREISRFDEIPGVRCSRCFAPIPCPARLFSRSFSPLPRLRAFPPSGRRSETPGVSASRKYFPATLERVNIELTHEPQVTKHGRGGLR